MNVLWSSMLLLGIVYGAIQGRMPEVTDGVIRASREAVVLAVSLVGVTGFWAGLMEIAKKAGVIDGLVKRMGRAAMERVEELEEERRKTKNPAAVPEGTANREMCTFLILNISSLQLIPVIIIAYRSQYGSVHPTAIVGPALAATAASTIAAVVFCKVMERLGR